MSHASKLIITGLLLLGTGSLYYLLAQGASPTQSDEPMEALAVAHTEAFTVHAPLEKVYDLVVDKDVLPKILKRYLFIPAVTGSTIHRGDWVTPGSYRTVYFSNGDTLKEELTHFQRPRYFAYRISDFSGFQRHFASHGVGQWWFTAYGNTTQVEWTYTFYAKSKFKQAFLRPFVNHDFKTYMKRSIALIKAQLEPEKEAQLADEK
jgi:hypothetical protein